MIVLLHVADEAAGEEGTVGPTCPVCELSSWMYSVLASGHGPAPSRRRQVISANLLLHSCADDKGLKIIGIIIGVSCSLQMNNVSILF